MITTSRITGISYDPDAVIYITDVSQWSFYFENGCNTDVLDILYDPSRNVKRPLCMVFRKNKKTREVYDKWLQRGEEISKCRKQEANSE